MERLALKRRMGGSAVATEKVIGVGGSAEGGIISVAYVMIALPRMFFTFCLFRLPLIFTLYFSLFREAFSNYHFLFKFLLYYFVFILHSP